MVAYGIRREEELPACTVYSDRQLQGQQLIGYRKMDFSDGG